MKITKWNESKKEKKWKRARGKKLIDETKTLLNLESSPFNSFPNFPTLPRFYEYPQIFLVRNHSDSSNEKK